MALLQSPCIDAALPPELVSSVIYEGERDAHYVGHFLKSYGLLQPNKPLRLPKRFLIFLALGLRLYIYEQKQLFMPGELNFPNGESVIRMAFRSLSDKTLNPNELKQQIYDLSIDRFAWNAQPDFNADFILPEVSQDLFLDAIADFLWSITSS